MPADLFDPARCRTGLRYWQRKYRRDPSPQTRASMGTDYLRLGRLDAAAEIFDDLLWQKSPADHDGLYVYCGLVRWLWGHSVNAVDYWMRGLKCSYTDDAGGVELPLLLYYASTCDPMLYDPSDATNLLKQKLKSRRAKNWPGPIARYVLKRIDEARLRKLARFDPLQVEREQIAQAEFYVAIVARGLGDRRRFVQLMKRCATSLDGEMSHEPFLARHELDLLKTRGK